jgi:hypothetical protein
LTDTFTEAPLSVNFKPATGFDAPMLTIRAMTPAELMARVNGTIEAGLFAVIGNADKEFKAAYNVGNILGATPVSAPAPAAPQAPAHVAAPAPQADAWGAQAPAWGAQATAPAPQAYAAPAPAAAPAAGAAGAPFIPAFQQAATFRSGQGAKGPWSAYLDPRPKQVTDAIPVDHTGKTPSTDDVNHPGLAAGTHKFAKFLR